MNAHPSSHRFPIILILLVILAILAAGIFRAFAAGTPTPTPPAVSATPSPPPPPSPTPPPGLVSADTTGIIALVIVMVAIVIFGIIWGRRMTLLHLLKPGKK